MVSKSTTCLEVLRGKNCMLKEGLMRRFTEWWILGCLASTAMACGDVVSSQEPLGEDRMPVSFSTCGSNCSSWVYPSHYPGNYLIYVPDDEGDRIPDFGRSGYKKSKGGLLSETMPALGTAYEYDGPPSLLVSGDICRTNPPYTHGEAIQDQIDEIRGFSENSSGVRGRLLLPRGHYAVWNRLVVPDGVILAGTDEDPTPIVPATTLHACGTDERNLIVVGEPDGDDGVLGDPIDILDEIVPVGATSVVVGATNQTIERDKRILIERQVTSAWIADIGLDGHWDPEDQPAQTMERTVTHTESAVGFPTGAKRIFFEHPVTNALEGKYGPHRLFVYGETPQRAVASGVYRLRGKSNQEATLCKEQGDPCATSRSFISVDRAIDSWVKEVVAEGFPESAIKLNKPSRQITVENARSVTPFGPESGTWRYTFKLEGRMNLVANCSAGKGRHDFIPDKAPDGPNVFLDCESNQASRDSGSHQDWSRGTLFDNVVLTSTSTVEHAGRITAENRYFEDIDNPDPKKQDSHGWTGANLVVWNSTAEGYEYFNPPTAQNWLIGSIGEPREQPNVNDETGAIAPELLESHPHYDFRNPAEHGTPAVLTGDSSLFRTANAQWRSYLSQGFELEARHYFMGDPDQPAFGEIGDVVEPSEQVYVNPGFSTWVSSSYGAPVTGFDVLVTNHSVPFTFRYQLEPNEEVVHAYLAARIERTTWTSDANHHVTLTSRGSGTPWSPNNSVKYYWRCQGVPNCTQIPPEMTGPEGWPTNTVDPVVRILDLHQHRTFLNNKDSNGWAELNVNFFKRTRVDWASLTMLVKRTP